MSPVKKLIIDTDAGIDDAAAIVMALEAHMKGEVEVMAITCLTGNTALHYVIKNVCRIMETVGCVVPLYAGATDSLVISNADEQENFHGVDGFNDVKFDSDPDVGKYLCPGPASDAIRKIIRDNPGQITLVPIGPLTNVAITFASDEELPSMLKEMVIMGGNMEGKGNVTRSAEFNFHADPEAAYVVLRRCHTCPSVKLVPWETCLNNKPSQERRWEVWGEADTPAAALLNKIEEPWVKLGRAGSMADQQAMAVALEEDNIVKKETKHYATVELGGHLARGMMVLEQRPEWCRVANYRENVTVVEELDSEVFDKRMMRAFSCAKK